MLELIKEKKIWLIDCDGTLADTMPAHDKAYELAFLLNDVPFDKEKHEEFAPFGGKVLMKETVIKKGYSEATAQNIVKDKQRLLSVCLTKFMKPNRELIDLIVDRPADVKVYIVSNGRRASIKLILDALGLTYWVNGLITPELLGSVKPSPEPYNYAMVVAGMDLQKHISPKDVLVFEDNRVGIDSAINAGIYDIIKVNTEDFSHEKI